MHRLLLGLVLLLASSAAYAIYPSPTCPFVGQNSDNQQACFKSLADAEVFIRAAAHPGGVVVFGILISG